MAAPTITLPTQFEGRTLSKVTADVVTYAQDGWPPDIIFDFQALTFVRPAGIVFLSNLIYWLHEKGTKVQFVNCNVDKSPIRYLDDSLFFEQHCDEKLQTTASPRSTTRPLLRIAQKDSHAWLENNLVPWLAGRLSTTEASLYTYKACISELFNNIQDHTRYDIGSIFVQHFPSEKSITISLSDFGMGIPDKVREKLPGISDSDAIIQSVQDGFTTKSKPTNKGVGLDYLLKAVVLGNGGKVTIYSSEGIVRFWRSGTSVRNTVLTDVGFCPGTTIDIGIRTDTIELVPDEREDMTW